MLIKEALDLAPQSAYVQARAAVYELAQGRIGAALDRANEACRRSSPKTGALCYGVLARVRERQFDKRGCVEALARAVEFEPKDLIVRHQYGVALSRAGRTQEAVEQFTTIIDTESKRNTPRQTLLMALQTRVINLRRLGRTDEADADLARARETAARYPHLNDAAKRLADLSD